MTLERARLQISRCHRWMWLSEPTVPSCR